jgi:hypothetical protein
MQALISTNFSQIRPIVATAVRAGLGKNLTPRTLQERLLSFRHPSMRELRARLALASLILLGGCQSLEYGHEEMTWQALHAMDIAQTLSAADDPCYEEDAWLTQKLIGKQPSDAEVMAWGVGTAVAHLAFANALESWNAPRWLQKAWSYGTISYTGLTVANNYNEGVRMSGNNQDVKGCYL